MPYSNHETQKEYMREYMRLRRAKNDREIGKTEFWQKLRLLALERDHYSCQLCHINIKEVLTAHHVNENHEDNRLENLKTLCFNCHFMVHSHPEALAKIEDWRNRGIDQVLLGQLLEAFRSKHGRFNTAYCVFHGDRRSDITLSYDLQTGKLLSNSRAFGLCRSCWAVVADQGEDRLVASPQFKRFKWES